MNTLAITLILTLLLSFSTFATLVSPPQKKDPPAKLARYQTGAYLTADGKKLRVNIDKQLGGRVYVRLNDLKGTIYFTQTLSPTEMGVRLSLDLTELTDGDYLLNVSNGLEMVVRTLTITTKEPTIAPRSITVR